MSKCAVVYLEYLEPNWQATQMCLDRLPHLTIKADRLGYLGIPRAFNEAFSKVPAGVDYVWFVTNITFTRQDIDGLVAAMDRTGYAAISPCFDSDHPHLRPHSYHYDQDVQVAKFVEFTCPIVRADVFRQFPLDEEMPYDIHDLDWSHRVKMAGHTLGVHYGVKVNHVYLRNSTSDHWATKKRKRYRAVSLERTHKKAAEKWGQNWRELIWT